MFVVLQMKFTWLSWHFCDLESGGKTAAILLFQLRKFPTEKPNKIMCTMYITGEDFVKFIMDFYKRMFKTHNK